MSLYSLNIKPKCYKVVCNLLDSEEDYTFNDLYSDFNIDDYDDKLEIIRQHYRSPNNVKQMIFVFTGEFNDQIKVILDNIHDNISYNNLSTENRSLLNDYFKYDISNEWSILSQPSVKKIYFVPHLIHDFDNVSYLHTLISSVVSNYTKANEIFFRQFVKTSDLFMYTDNVIHLEDQFEEFKKNILMTQKNKSYSFNIEFIESKLNHIGIPNTIINKLFNKYDNDLTRIAELLEDNLLKDLFMIYKSFCPLTLMIKYKKNYIYNSTNITDKIYGKPINISDSTYTVENALFDNQLRNITNSDTIFLYTQINVTKFITDKHGDKNLESFYGTLYKYYFYNTDKTNIKSIVSENILANYTDIVAKYDILNYYIRTLDTFDLFETNDDNETLSNVDIQPLIVNIRTRLNFPTNYSFLELFNNITLSSDIPFTKYRDTIANDIVFKIFKPITYSEGVGYLPEVSIDQLNNWIKYKGFDLDNFKIKAIKSNPREVFFKIKVETFYTNNLLYGIVDKIIHSDSDNIIYNIKSGSDILSGIDKIEGNVQPKDEDISIIDVGTEVKFNEKKTVYADIEVYKRGILGISVNTKEYDNESMEDIINKIFLSVNKFIHTIFEEDRLLVQFQQFKHTFSENTYFQDNIHLLTDYSENNLYSNNSALISTENGYSLNWYNIYELLEILHPLVEIPEEKFEKDDEVIYQDQDGIATDTFDAIIKNKNIADNSYTITYKSDSETITKNDIKSRFLSIKGNYDKSLITFYFKTNKGLVYDKTNKIFKFIDKSRIVGYNVKEITDRLRDNFPDDITSQEVAQTKIQEFLNSTGLNMKTFNTYTDTNPQITINLGSVKKLENDSFETNLYVENIGDYYTYKQITKFISFLFEAYNYKFHNDDNTNVNIKNLLDYVDRSDINITKNTGDIVKAKVTSNTRIGANIYEDVSGQVLGDDFIDSDLESDDEDEEDDNTLINNEEDVRQAFKNDSMIIGQSRLSKNTILDSLYNRAPKLFFWENKENPRKTYTGICQGVKRYPKILSEEQKKAIDERDKLYFKGENSGSDVNNKNFKNVTKDIDGYISENENSRSYNTTLNDNTDCTDSNSKSITSKCSAIKYGTESNKNWFICPKIYDIKDSVPLHWTMLNYNKIKGKTFIPLDYNDITKWRIDANTGKDITDYKPSFKGRGVVNTKSNKVAPTSKNSLVLIDKGSQYSYPGFLNKTNNPYGFFPPCCYNSNMRMADAFNPKSKERVGRPNTYIQGQYKELGYRPLRYGLLPDELSSILDNDSRICSTGELSDRKKCFFRVGNQQGNESFLGLMSDIFFDKIDINYIKNFIVKNLTYEQFRSLNGGSLEIKFRNYGKQSSFQNFIEYTLSNEYKDYTLYYEFFSYYSQSLSEDDSLSRKFKEVVRSRNIHPNDNNPTIFHLIFDTVYTKNEKGIPVRSYELLCPYFLKNIYKAYNNTIFFTISIKNKSSFEPIYYLKGSHKTLKLFLFKIHSYSSNESETYKLEQEIKHAFTKNIRLIIADLLGRCGQSTESDIVQISKYIGGPSYDVHSKNKYKLFDILLFYKYVVEEYPNLIGKFKSYIPTSLIFDDYNRVYGIRLKNKAVIPIYPDIIDRNLLSMFNNFVIKYYVVIVNLRGKKLKITVSKNDIDIINPSKGQTVLISRGDKNKLKGNIAAIKHFKFNILYEFSYNMDYEPTNLNIQLETFDFIKEYSNKINNISEIDIKPIYYFLDPSNNDKANGFIANTGSYINIKSSLINTATSNLIKNNYYTVDKELIKYQKVLFENIYLEPLKLSEIRSILERTNTEVVDAMFTFDKIFVNGDNDLIAIVNNYGIVIPLAKEAISVYNDYISQNSIEKIALSESDNEPKYNIEITKSLITIEDYITLAKDMSNALDNEVPMKVFGFLMDNNKKCIKGIILNTGFVIKLSQDLRFEINLKDIETNEFKINKLVNSIFNDTADLQLTNLKPITMKDKIITEFNYSLSSYRVAKYIIFKLLQNSSYRFIREFIRNLVYSIEINNFVKKLILIPVMNIIFNITIQEINYKPEVYPNITIDNVGNLEKCLGKHIQKTDNDWKTKYNKIDNINDYINLTLSIIFGEINEGNIDIIKNKIGLEDDVTVENLVENIKQKIGSNDIDFITNNVIKTYNNFLKIIPDVSCKLKIFNLKSKVNSNINKIIDELIQNNYSKIEILESFKVLSGNERYKFNRVSEIFLSNKELDNRNKLLELYNNVKKLYYRNIMDFDSIKLSAKIIKRTDTNRESISGCKVTDGQSHTINIIPGAFKKLKNKGSGINPRLIEISDKDMADIFKLNTELTSCISRPDDIDNKKITYVPDMKKKLIYKAR